MRIITVNLPVPYLKMIDGLVGERGLYPSRSELIRVAVRDYLIKEMKSALDFPLVLKYNADTPVVPPTPELDTHVLQIDGKTYHLKQTVVGDQW
jgi:antitoxin ParD1/3/4